MHFLQTEVDQWQEINKQLKKHGLPIVKIFHPSDVTLMSGMELSLETKV
jgi:hypothetical protein